MTREEFFTLEPPLDADGRPERHRGAIRGRVTLPDSAAADPAAGPLPWVLVLHGFKGFMNWGFFPLLSRRLAERGLAAVAFNTSCSGIGDDLETFSELEAFAHATLTRQLEDVERVRVHACRASHPSPEGPEEPRGIFQLDPARAGLFGHSRGGGAALLHAAQHPGAYRALVTWAAVDTFDRWDEATKALWRRAGTIPIVNARTGQELPLDVEVLEDHERNADRFDVLSACGRIDAPTLCLHGSRDEAVGVEALARLIAALPPGLGRAVEVEGAGHTFGATHPLKDVPPALDQVLVETVDWFAAHLTGATSPRDSVTSLGSDRT